MTTDFRDHSTWFVYKYPMITSEHRQKYSVDPCHKLKGLFNVEFRVAHMHTKLKIPDTHHCNNKQMNYRFKRFKRLNGMSRKINIFLTI